MNDFDPAILRILDANFNRAGEALRVWEEYARFQLEDRNLSESIKQLRHDLTASVPDSLRASMIYHRDSAGDVGQAIETSSEYQRAGAWDVAQANGQRASQALRAIEEYSKPCASECARQAEAIRYQVYDIERRLQMTHCAHERVGHMRLYVIITESLCKRDWYETAEAAIQGGADAIQLREKTLPDRELTLRAKKLASLCRAHNALFIMNDRPDIARLVDAHGLHLGQDDMTIADARRLLPSHMIVGMSTHTPQQVDRAIQETPDYIALGPMFATSTKPQDHIPGPALLSSAVQKTSLPLVAIGGIDIENITSITASAPRACVCVCSCIIGAENPAEATADLCTHLHKAASPISPLNKKL